MKKRNEIVKSTFFVILLLLIVPTILFSGVKKAKAQVATAQVSNTSALSVLNAAKNTVTSLETTSSAISDVTIAGVATQTLPLTGISTGIDIKEFALSVLQQALIVIGHQMLNQITQSTVNWINSGFHGEPLFVQNPESFFGNIEQSAIKNVVNQVGYDPLQPFGKQFALNLINQYKASSAKDTQYTLSQVTTNSTTLNNYQTNFFSGGWNAFLVNTQYPQNNYLGYNMKMSNIVYGQTTTANTGNPVQNLAQKAQTLLSQGKGFLSPTMCPTNAGIPNAAAYNASMTNEFNTPVFTPNYSALPDIPDCIPDTNIAAAMDANPSGAGTSTIASSGCINQSEIDKALISYNTDYNQQQTNFNNTTACVDPKTGKSALVATTPGAVVASQITNALNIRTGSTELDSAIGNSISVILNSLMNHFLQEGLSDLSGVVQSAPSVDNWSYNGLTLTGTNTTGNPLVVPTNLSLNVGDTSPTMISGGKAPYTVVNANSQIATAQISGTSLSVTGVSQGTTSITVSDSSSPVQTSTVAVTVSTNGNIIINFTNTTQNPKSVSVGVGNSINLTMSGGTAPYSIQTQPDSTISLALMNNNVLTLVGSATGNTSVTLQDSAGNTINLNIVVGNAETPLAVSPTSISANVASAGTVTISGGTAPYSITTPASSSIASVLVSNNNTLSVLGVAAGTTSVTIQDSYSPAETITIPITINNAPVISSTTSPQNISVQTGSSTTISIVTNGTVPSIITTPNSAIATAQLNSTIDTLTVTGVTPGSTSLVIQTSSASSSSNTNTVVGNGTTSSTTAPTNITVNITVTPAAGSNTTF